MSLKLGISLLCALFLVACDKNQASNNTMPKTLEENPDNNSFKNFADRLFWASGPQDPEQSLGSKDDFYLNTTTGNVFKKNQEGLWTLTANISGPQGAAGIQGEKGDKGDQGDAGVQGVQGIQGLIGLGPQGLKGDKGDKGDQGDAGTNGSNGTNGTNGIDGNNGQDGLNANSITLLHQHGIATASRFTASRSMTIRNPSFIETLTGSGGNGIAIVKYSTGITCSFKGLSPSSNPSPGTNYEKGKAMQLQKCVSSAGLLESDFANQTPAFTGRPAIDVSAGIILSLGEFFEFKVLSGSNKVLPIRGHGLFAIM